MNTRGFVKLPRSLLEWRWYGDLNTRPLYIHLLMSAAWDDAMYMNRKIKRGQCCTTVKELSAINQRTIQQTRTVLNHLVSTNDITIEAPPQLSILTLTNYDELQPVGKPPSDSFADRPTLAVGEFRHLRTYCESCLFNDEIVEVGVYIIRKKHSDIIEGYQAAAPPALLTAVLQMEPHSIGEMTSHSSHVRLSLRSS